MKQSERKLLRRIRKFISKKLKKSRLEHSLRVASTSVQLAGIYGVDRYKAYLAGISHDMCKYYSMDRMISIIRCGKIEISDFEKESSELLHGKAAAVLMKTKFKVFDEDVLEAVANHTLGCRNISDLGKILFIADKVEPGREHSSEEYRRNLFSKSLDEAVLLVAEESNRYLSGKGLKVAPESIDFMEWMKKRLEK